MTRTYFIEVKHTVTERFHIEADFEDEARRKAKSGDLRTLRKCQEQRARHVRVAARQVLNQR